MIRPTTSAGMGYLGIWEMMCRYAPPPNDDRRQTHAIPLSLLIEGFVMRPRLFLLGRALACFGHRGQRNLRYRYVTTTSTRRFLARPAAVLLRAIGLLSP